MVQRAQLEAWEVPGKVYPTPLPKELEAAYAYISDQGHAIIVLIDELVPAGGNPDDYLLPVPVRLVLELGHTVDDTGRVHIKMGQGMSYELPLGLEIPEGYDEW